MTKPAYKVGDPMPEGYIARAEWAQECDRMGVD